VGRAQCDITEWVFGFRARCFFLRSKKNRCGVTHAHAMMTLFQCDVVECIASIGCVARKKECDDNDACTQDSCNPVTGDCVHTNITVDDSNKCMSWLPFSRKYI
jgi:hypothetical protein